MAQLPERRTQHLIGLALALTLALAAPSAAAEAQWQGSSRLGMGFGKYHDPLENKLPFTMNLRGEAVRPTRKRPQWLFGPSVEVRTSDFRTAEAGGGIATLLKLGEGAAFGLHTLVSYAYRHDYDNGAVLSEILTLGFRRTVDTIRPGPPRSPPSPYMFGLNLFLAGRVGLDDQAIYEVTGGVELDLAFFAIPYFAMRNNLEQWRAKRKR